MSRSLTLHPIADWLIQPAGWQPIALLLNALCEKLVASGFPLWRLSSSVATAHPEVAVTNVTWVRGQPLREEQRSHSSIEADYSTSPVRRAQETGESIRRRLESGDPGFPQLKELAARGATDYYLQPLATFYGHRSWISIASDAPGGFTDEHVATWEGLIPFVQQRLELSAVRFAAQSLLRVYLGQTAGAQVMAGNFRRGTGELVAAAIWYCDLRGFTSMVDNADVREVVRVLDRYFECTAGSVEAAGGEVLKFIGDAVLGIFPVADRGISEACTRALGSAIRASEAMAKWNGERAGKSLPPIGCGIGLHLGEVMFGNIGCADRLDFTVIGSAVNEVARIESLTRPLDVPLLMSRGFANAADAEDVVSLGRHPLKGVSEPPEVLTLRRFASS